MHNWFIFPFLGSDSWPSDAQLYQPFEVEQILLNDNASCLAVQAFLNMTRLDFAVEMRANAEHMSPNGKKLSLPIKNAQESQGNIFGWINYLI